ncbi:hypothetical protein ACQY0O_005465 [Thecaphora frezii]
MRSLPRFTPHRTGGSSTPLRALLASHLVSRSRSLSTTPPCLVPRRDTSALHSKYYDKMLKSAGNGPAPSQDTNRSKEAMNTMLQRDQELLQKLLDREGGAAGVATVDGNYEEGLGKETKKNMFRLI